MRTTILTLIGFFCCSATLAQAKVSKRSLTLSQVTKASSIKLPHGVSALQFKTRGNSVFLGKFDQNAYYSVPSHRVRAGSKQVRYQLGRGAYLIQQSPWGDGPKHFFKVY